MQRCLLEISLRETRSKNGHDFFENLLVFGIRGRKRKRASATTLLLPLRYFMV